MNYNDVQLGLEEIGAQVKVIFKGAYALVQCPFHKDGNETNPSLMVNLTNDRFDVGFHYCLSCGAKGDWNALANAFDLDIAQNQENALNQKAHAKEFIIRNKDLKDPIIASSKDKSVSIDWPANEYWRGINGQILSDLKCKLRLDYKSNDKQIVLPVSIANKNAGYIYALLFKRSKELGSSYINSPGNWVKKSLFPFDYTSRMLRNNKLPLCLVEGPRDALNLIQFGLPALAILGCTNWSKSNIPLILSLHFSNFLIMMDGDEAGNAAMQLIYKDLSNYISRNRLIAYKLNNNSDPADLDSEQVKQIIAQFS